MEAGWIAVGKLTRVRGNRGELLGEIYSSQPGRAEKLKSVVLEVGSRRLAAQIEDLWHHDGRPVFKFVGIDSISDAEPWAGADVLVPESEQTEVAEGEYSHADLIGCRVATAADKIGVVTGSRGLRRSVVARNSGDGRPGASGSVRSLDLPGD